jgi:predicted DNA-binding protein with PD1-like motif
MKFKRLTDNGGKTWAIIMETGDEPMSSLENFACEHQVTAAYFTAIGAFEKATIAYFDWEKKQYRDIPIDEQVEVLTMAGDIALKDGKPKVHTHLVVGRSDGTTRGGHLKEARVRPTLEVMLTESPTMLQRVFDSTSGLALIDPTA